MTNKLQNTFLIPIILLTFLLNGCGVWEDFTTFFNTYYNAGKTFDLAMEEIEKLEADKFEFKQKPLGGNLKQNLELVIEKCSKILQFHQESSYFDDALYMIGIAFYYQGDYSKGLRKFHELASVEDSDLQLENKLWIAKCELQLRNFDQGFNRLEDLKTEALEAEEKEIVEKALITQIGYLIYRENYLTAINYLNNLMEVSESDELRAETAFQQGKIYLVLNEQENAAAAFQSVMDYSPTFDVEFSSQFEYAKLQKELNKDSLSLDLLNDLRDENKFDEFRHKIELEIGLLYYEQGKIEDALDKFRLVDTVYTKTESSGIAAFMRGEIWEKHYKNYDSAFYFYDRTSASQAPKEVKDEAREKNNVINDYFTLNEKYMANAKQYVYLVDPEKFIRDSLDYEAAVSFDSTLAAKSDSTDEEGNLTTGGDRRNTFGNRDKRTPTGGNKGSGQPGNGRTKAIKQLTQPKRPTLTLDSLNSIIAKNKFELGNLFFSELEVPDSAFYYYSSVLNDYDSTDYDPETYYALGIYYSTISQKSKADSLYLIVYNNYPNEEVAEDAGRKLGLITSMSTKDPAEPIYVEAEDKMLSEQYDSAIDDLYTIFMEHPKSPYAPKALYTIGWILENNLADYDSAASVYDILTTQYRVTDYAKAVTPKLSEFKREQQKILERQKAIEDSITQAFRQDSIRQAAVQDSIKQANQPKLDEEQVESEELLDETASPADSTQMEFQREAELPDSTLIKNQDSSKTIPDSLTKPIENPPDLPDTTSGKNKQNLTS